MNFDIERLLEAETSKVLLHTNTDRKQLVVSAVTRQKLLRAASQGMSAKAAAALIGCDYSMARNAYRDRAFQLAAVEMVNGNLEKLDASLRARSETMSEKIDRASQRAFEVLMDALEDEQNSPSLRVRVAEGFLDRNPESSRHSTTAVAHEHRFSVDELVQAAAAAEELTRHKIIPISKVG